MTRWILLFAVVASGCTGTDGDRDASTDGTIPSGTACGATTCAASERCCDHCTGACVPETSGAFCPDDADPAHACIDGSVGVTWASCADAHGSATDGDACTFTDSCGDCCCEGRTSCIDGRIATALCDCLCMP